MAIVGYTLLTDDVILPNKVSDNVRNPTGMQKSEKVNENPCATWTPYFVLTQAENLNSKAIFTLSWQLQAIPSYHASALYE